MLVRSRGFSLVEVLVAVVIIAIGLLGLAKMESLALSSTGVASMRSLVAIEASSLAASMRANRGFWATGAAYATQVVDSGSNNFASAADCTTLGSSACTPQQMAAFDLKQWAQAMSAVLPGNAWTSTIACATANFPVNCTITIQWTEQIVTNSSATAGNNQSFTNQQLLQPTYTLYVQP